jgi:hypothetical protein
MFRIPIKDFVFDEGLMQNHFNESYMERGKFPNPIYKGAFNREINFYHKDT